MSKNLTSDDLLNKRESKLIFELDKYILFKSKGVYEREYSCNAMI